MGPKVILELQELVERYLETKEDYVDGAYDPFKLKLRAGTDRQVANEELKTFLAWLREESLKNPRSRHSWRRIGMRRWEA